MAIAINAIPSQAQTANDTPKWDAHVDLEGKVGTKRNLGESDLFLPLAQTSDTLLFGDFRARLDDRDSREGNFGLGVRHMLESGWNVGGYGYFDRRFTAYDHSFNQLTLGAEALGRDFDVRANSYWPLGDRTKAVDTLSTASLSGSTITVRGGEEHSMRGFDGEVGWRVPVFDAEADRQVRIYAGGYRFTADGVDAVQGPRGRIDFTLYDVPFLWQGSQLDLGAEVQHDDPRGTQAFAGLRLRIPLQVIEKRPARLNAQERRMTEAVMRDVDIVTRAGALGAPEAATQTAVGSALTVLDSSNTTGANLPTAVAAAGANSTVVLSGTFATTAVTTLQAGQTVMGGGALRVMSPSGRVATLTVPGATVNGAVPGNNGTFHMGNDSTLTGLTISNVSTGGGTPNPFAVFVSGVSNATVSNNRLTVTENLVGGTAQGILIRNASSNISVLNNTISATGTQVAIGINVVQSSATVSGNTLSAAGSGGSSSRAFAANAPTELSGSGNTIVQGLCQVTSPGVGSVSFTNGTTCP